MTVSTSIITTIAGTGTSSLSGDGGPATSATLKYPYGVSVDASGRVASFVCIAILIDIFIHNTGNVYIADTLNNRIRKVAIATGIITTMAGSTTTGGFSGDGGQATSAEFNNPFGVAVDSTGQIIILFIRFIFCYCYDCRQRVRRGSS